MSGLILDTELTSYSNDILQKLHYTTLGEVVNPIEMATKLADNAVMYPFQATFEKISAFPALSSTSKRYNSDEFSRIVVDSGYTKKLSIGYD